MRVASDHRLVEAIWCESPHCDDRPQWAEPELIVIHCVSLPEGQFGTGAPERLFEGCLDTTEHETFADLEGVHVAPHLLILRDGTVKQFVELDKRAWHAGVSTYGGRSFVNDFSIGIELEGCVQQGYENRQYESLNEVVLALCRAYPTLSPERIVGHSEIAPNRKEDPGPNFDWTRLLARLLVERRGAGRKE